MSMTMASAPCLRRQAVSSASTARNGSSSSAMKMRPMALITRTSSAGRRPDQRGAAAWRALGIVDRPYELRIALDEDERLLLVEGVIAERHRVGAGFDQLLEDRLGDAEAAGGVLAVDDDEVEARSGGASRAARRRPPCGRCGRRYRREKADAFRFRSSVSGLTASAPSRGAGHSRDGARRRPSARRMRRRRLPQA